MNSTQDIATLLTLLTGLSVTLELSAVVLVIGTIGGIVFASFSFFGGRWARIFTDIILFLTRGLPLLVQVFAIFYFLPILGLSFGRFATAVVALGAFASVTIGEIIRGGLLSIPKGQIEAAKALGLSFVQSAFLVVFPQVVRIVLGPIVGQFVFLVKATSIISLLGVPELVLAAREIIERTLEGFKVMALVWFFYTLICLPMSMLGRWVERRMAIPGYAPGPRRSIVLAATPASARSRPNSRR
jgi:polar amino acid transport system permease protein